MLIGAVAVAIPIAIHLYGRRRAEVVKFAAIDFLLGSDEKLARRLKTRDLLLLILRVLVCVALAVIVAKPYTSCEATGPEVGGGPQAAVFVIDNSLASGYGSDGETVLAAAAERAARIIEQLGPDSEVALVLTAAGSQPPAELSADQLKLIDDIRALEPAPRPADTTTALRRAAELLATSPRATRRIFLLSPLIASGFRADESPWPAGSGPQLTVVDLAEGDRLDNLAVVGVEVERDPDSGSRGLRVTATIANFGAAPAREVKAQLRIGERVVARGTVDVGAGAEATKSFSGSIPEGARSAPVTVEISGDRLAADNRRHAIGELRDQVRTLLVNGDPRSSRHADELFYIDAALRPGDRAESGIELTRSTPDELAGLDLSATDVVVLANSRALGDEVVSRLAAWVRGGGGLLVALGDRVDPDAYNKSMKPLLAQELRSVLDTSFGRRGDEASGSALHLAKIEVDHPVFSPFARDAPELREAGFARVMLLGPTSGGDHRVLARYDNGATAMVEGPLGRGRLILYTSTLDRDWNELPIQPGFVPLAQQLVRYLGRKPSDLHKREGVVGASRSISLAGEVRRVEVRTPSGERSTRDIDHSADGGRVAIQVTDTGDTGFYQVWIAREGSDKLEALSSEDFALNVDPAASDLARLDPDNLPAGAGGGGAEIAEATHTRRLELWHAIAALLLGFLLLESLLTLRG
jgi:hypothetical protein